MNLQGGDIASTPGSLRLESLHAFSCREEEPGFLFAGASVSMWELTFVADGAVHCVADGQDFLLAQGDMMLCAPGQWHMQYADPGVAPRYLTACFAVSGRDLTGLKNRRFCASSRAYPLACALLREHDAPDAYSADAVRQLLMLTLVELLREADETAQAPEETLSADNENAIVCRAQQYISAHARNRLSVPLAAAGAGVSPSYLTALFHKNLQISPGEYIRRIKLQESKQMIRENTMNFTQIAAALEYSTVHHFSRQFKEKFGITPSEYARSVR